MPEYTPDHLPADPSRSDLELWRQALRNDWAIPPAVRRRMLQVAVNLADPPEEEEIPRWRPTPDGEREGPGDVPPAEGYTLGQRVRLASVRDRTKLGALRVIAQFATLNARQAAVDLALARFERERAAGPPAHEGAPRRIVIPGADDGSS